MKSCPQQQGFNFLVDRMASNGETQTIAYHIRSNTTTGQQATHDRFGISAQFRQRKRPDQLEAKQNRSSDRRRDVHPERSLPHARRQQHQTMFNNDIRHVYPALGATMDTRTQKSGTSRFSMSSILYAAFQKCCERGGEKRRDDLQQRNNKQANTETSARWLPQLHQNLTSTLTLELERSSTRGQVDIPHASRDAEQRRAGPDPEPAVQDGREGVPVEDAQRVPAHHDSDAHGRGDTQRSLGRQQVRDHGEDEPAVSVHGSDAHERRQHDHAEQQRHGQRRVHLAVGLLLGVVASVAQRPPSQQRVHLEHLVESREVSCSPQPQVLQRQNVVESRSRKAYMKLV
ncbi:hypothetical protein ON010_g12737 [Phytophthora cinnamomi]|nr:hypothetical protein ON010_g12737 [Phytophthora cinnamomi]